MFVTIVEGAVEAERERDLRSAWDEVSAVLPAGLIESSLLRSDDGTWRIVTVWESKEAVMAMRASGETADADCELFRMPGESFLRLLNEGASQASLVNNLQARPASTATRTDAVSE